jgi:serine/threonine protein kinase
MDTIGKYQLVRIIGEGGMGRVYEAIDPIIGRRVAVKTISLSVATDAETRSRFFREAQAAGQLSHPNLITIHDIGDADGTPYIVMEYLEGVDLNRKMRQERLSYDAKMQIMIDVCEGLAFAHGRDIVHRDIKPANIFVTPNGRAKILDFGLARGVLSDVTQTGKIVGTPNYMSPEQIRDEGVDHRSDIFAAGVVFYELLCGRKAFEGDSVATTLYKVLETQPQPVHLIDDQLPATLSGVIERALAKDRLARFQTSGEMLEAVLHAHGRTTEVERSHLASLPRHTPPRGTTAVPVPARRSRATIAAWTAAGVAVAGLAGFALWSRQSQEPRQAPPIAQASPSSSAPAQTTVPEAPPPTPPERAGAPAPPDNAALPKAAATKAPAAVVKPAAAGSHPVTVPSVVSPPAPAPPPDTRTAPALPAPILVPPPAPEAKPTPIEPPPVTAPVVSPAPPAPAPAAPPPSAARTEENPQTAIQAVLARYRAALESRDINALKRIWPGLSGRQEDAIRNEFEHSRAIAVGLEGVDIRPAGTGATVTCRRNYAVTTGDGQILRTATTMVMTLVHRESAWNIEAIRHEVAR